MKVLGISSALGQSNTLLSFFILFKRPKARSVSRDIISGKRQFPVKAGDEVEVLTISSAVGQSDTQLLGIY